MTFISCFRETLELFLYLKKKKLLGAQISSDSQAESLNYATLHDISSDYNLFQNASVVMLFINSNVLHRYFSWDAVLQVRNSWG